MAGGPRFSFGKLWIGALLLSSCASPPQGNDAEQKGWEERFRRDDTLEKDLGKPVDIQGSAESRKVGAFVNGYWIDGLDRWPADLDGKKVRVTGTLIRRDDLPVFHPKPRRPNEFPEQGIPVPEGVDLERARRRYLIAHPQWTRLED